MADLALLDLVAPYVLRGENLGQQHAALAILRVVRYDTAADELGIVIRGRCEFDGRPRIDTSGPGLVVDHNEAAFAPNDRSPVFDLRETTVDFELFVPRSGSAIISAGAGTITSTGFAATRAVLDVWDAPPLDPGLSDYPASGFTLDLILQGPSLRLPFLHPAKLNEQGLLTPDTSVTEVSIILPRLRFRVIHGNATGSQLTFELVAAGVSGLDDPGDIGVSEMISMTPPYAFVGGPSDRAFGFGFRSATLDLSNEWTPPAIIEKAGVGDDWTGLYLPEVRIFIAPEGARDFAFQAGAKELLIGFGESAGVWGDFEAALVNQGSGALTVSARFFDSNGRAYGIERTGANQATARLPQRTRMVVDVVGGRTPYTRRVRVGGGPPQDGAVFSIDLGTSSSQEIRITVGDTSATALEAILTIQAHRRTSSDTLPTPGTSPAPALEATLEAPSDVPQIVIASQNEREVVLATQPRDPGVRWTLDGGTESAPQATFSVLLPPGEQRNVRAQLPGQPLQPLDFFFYYDEPEESEGDLGRYAQADRHLSTQRAVPLPTRDREPVHADPIVAYRRVFEALSPGTALVIRGYASYENHPERMDYNYRLAGRRAATVRASLQSAFAARNFNYGDLQPSLGPGSWSAATWASQTAWQSRTAPGDRAYWKATVSFPAGTATADEDSQGTLRRPSSRPPETERPVTDSQPPAPRAPDWFRSVKLKVRLVRSTLIAGEIEGEIDINTAAEQQLNESGQLNGHPPPRGRSLANGAPLEAGNPADGITRFRLLCQHDPAVGRTTTLISVGADPADRDGLIAWGWLPGEPVQTSKDYARSLLGSYLTFWPLLVAASEGGNGEVGDAVLTGTALALPGVVALLPWFQVERVVLFGAEYLQRNRGEEFEGNLLFDIGVDWSANFLDLVIIRPQHPLSVRYKAIGLRLGNRTDEGTGPFTLRPIFDSSRGFTIDVASGGALTLAEPLGQILRVLGARISRSNPLTLEIDIGLGVDLGVVAVDRASLRVYLDEPRAPELTALSARVDIPGALVGSGYLEIGSSTGPGGAKISTIGGQIDLTLRPINLRVAAAVEIAQIPAEEGGPATGVYVGLNVVLPVGLPLGSSGLGIFGFRGIFGMHYQRNPTIGAGSAIPALAWLAAAGGQPHLLTHNNQKLWTPAVDRWAFGLGMLIGTMEGGVIMNLDGTFLLELPGPRILILLNARIISPPPTLDGLGMRGGILAVIEITPEHFLIGILIEWDIERLVKIVIPFEAVFPFPPDTSKWHIYLGARKDIGRPVEVNVLDIVKGTGYLMFKGDGLPAYPDALLPAIQGFGIGLGIGASLTWGNVDIGLYIRVGGGMDAVIGFDPFVLAGTIYVVGELRLFIISLGASARLTVIVNEQAGSDDLALYVHGEACGYIKILFFEIKGCVEVTVAGPEVTAPMPRLVDKVTCKSRSPALLAGTGVDRGIDSSLGDALEQEGRPALSDPRLLTVPIDVVPVVSLKIPAVVAAPLPVGGLGSAIDSSAPGLLSEGWAERGGEKYRYRMTGVTLERIDPGSGAVLTPAILGSHAPAVWWTLKDATSANATAQLALFTWEPAPATKALEKSDRLTETVNERWGRVCQGPAPAAAVLWTFQREKLGPSRVGWDLEGMVWPDPSGTRRSTPVDDKLQVRERWRSGDLALDGWRGISPALVVGGDVPCFTGPILTDLLPSNARPAVRLQGPPVIAAAEIMRRLGRGEPVTPSEMQSAFAAEAGALSTLAVATRSSNVTGGGSGDPASRLCQVRVLQAPIFDGATASPFADPTKTEEIARRRERLGIAVGPLEEVVVLRLGAFATLDMLLFVRRDLLQSGRMVVRALDKDGVTIAEVVASAADLTPPKPLPPQWTSLSGPWANQIVELLSFQRQEYLAAVHLTLGCRSHIYMKSLENLSSDIAPGDKLATRGWARS